jgi:hypothetical protein
MTTGETKLAELRRRVQSALVWADNHCQAAVPHLRKALAEVDAAAHPKPDGTLPSYPGQAGGFS